MPPEQLPWDRRDFRKHDRSGTDPRIGGGDPHRWRELQQHPHAPPPQPTPYEQPQQQRWYSDFRSSRPLPPGHGQGFVPFGSRYGDRSLEDQNCRSFGSRGDGRYFRNSRENKGSFTPKAPSWEPGASPSRRGKATIGVNNLRSIENTQARLNSCSSQISHVSHAPPNIANLSDQSQPLVKEKNGGISDGMAAAGQKSEKENCLGSIDWKPLKWTRSGSLSSRGSSFSHLSNSDSMGVESTETVAEVQPKNETPIRSPSPDAVACVVSTAEAESDETGSRKKPRLGWGEGLAKYEKKKVEVPEDGATKNELVLTVINTETPQSHATNLPDKSPGVASSSDCASPATPSLVACSSSQGSDENESAKETNADHDTTNLRRSPSIESQAHNDGPTFNLESLELASIANLSSLIKELLQTDDRSSAESSFMTTTSMNKLLVWKIDALKALEVTESEIDSLETELKSLLAQPGIHCTHPAGSSSPPGKWQLTPCQELVTPSNFAIRPAPLHIVSSGEMIVENTPVALEHGHAVLKDEDIINPGSAISKLVEMLPATFPSETEVTEGSMSLDVNNSKNGLHDEEKNSGCVDSIEVIGPTSSEDLASISNVHCDVDSIYDSILASNKDSAYRASEELNKLLPGKQCLFDTLIASSDPSLQKDSSLVKEKFLPRKRFLQFKEKVLTLKFKVLQHFWKEGRLVSVKKLRVKTRKKFDPSRNGHKKNRSSGRSRISCYAGSPQTATADEVIEFVNELLSESALKPCRNTLKMPALILDKEMKMSFISNNGLVEDPLAVEKERFTINPWTSEEKEIFIDKLATFGKDFRKIASFLDHKTIADCIEFYYKNHKSECFDKTRKNPDYVKQRKPQPTTYLVASGKRWNREANAASLDILGAASVFEGNATDGIHQKCTSGFVLGESSSSRPLRADGGALQRSNSINMYGNEREAIAADVLAGICGSLSSEAMSSCITSSVDPRDGYQDWTCPRVGSSFKRPLTPDITQNADDECSDESCGELNLTDWTDDEKSIFTQAVSSYGKDFIMISQCVGTRSMDQCKVFFSKARKCLELDQMQRGSGTTSVDVNGGDSDIDDGCGVETDSKTSYNGPECKMGEDLPPPDMKLNDGSNMIGSPSLRPDFKISEGENGLGTLGPVAAGSVLKNPLIGGCQVDDKLITDLNVDSKEQNGPDVSFVSVHEYGTMVVSSNTESKQGIEEEDDLGLPNGLSEAEHNALTEVSDRQYGEENKRQQHLSPEENLDNKTVEDRDVNSSEVSDISSDISGMKSEPQLAGNVSHPSDSLSSLLVDNISGYGKETDLETCSAETSCMSSLQRNVHLASPKSTTPLSVPIKYNKNANYDALLAVGVDGINNMHSQKIVRSDCQQYLSGCSSVGSSSSQILRGYPVSVQTVNEIRVANSKNLVALQNGGSKLDGAMHSHLHTEFFLEKCNGSVPQSKLVDSPFPPLQQSRDHPRSQSGCSSAVNKSSRNGDVKLFGKILTASQQKPDSSAQRANDKNSQDHKSGHQSLNLKLAADQKVKFDSARPKFNCENYVGSENIPVRSFGFWDGNRIQTGFPPLPDSALLLAKYPAAFSNCSMPSMKMEQPQLHGVVNSSDRPLNGGSVFQRGELNSGNSLAADYQALRNGGGLQPFTIDMKQTQDAVFAEMQRINGFNVLSGMQQEARARLGINVGRGQYSGVSDPVAAIKMHYVKAAAEQLSMQGGNAIKEDDRWRSM